MSSLSARAWAACAVRVRGVYSLEWSQRFQPHTALLILNVTRHSESTSSCYRICVTKYSVQIKIDTEDNAETIECEFHYTCVICNIYW